MISNRKNAILIGLYLSKFDKSGLEALDFKGSLEAFNILGYAIGVKPASIKNYRDEFDPYFSNPRKGWHGRQIREHCKVILNEYGDVEFDNFTGIIKSLLVPDYDVSKRLGTIGQKQQTESVAKRLVTGKAAESFFRENYVSVPHFVDFNLKDTTLMACGFDFLLEKGEDFFCVEVKGLNGKSGTITLTENEYAVAEKLCGAYCLYLVSNFIEKPMSQLIFNPLESKLKFTRTEKLISQITFSTHF